MFEMESLGQWIQLTISLITLAGLIIAIYKFSADPDQQNKRDISEMVISCDEKHKRLDEIVFEMRDRFKSIDSSLALLKENDIKHIENNIRDIRITQTKILTILEYKEGEKIK